MTPDQNFMIKLVTDPQYTWLLIVFLTWSLAWKGFALWKASKNNQTSWFIAILIFNTVGILEIFYLWLFSKKK